MFDIDTCLAFITGVTAKKVADYFNEILTKKGITRVQWMALYYIGKHNKLTQAELANLMNIKASTVVRLLDRMEREEYIIRERSLEDRRVIFISLTKKGSNLRTELLPEGEKMSLIVREGLNDEEIRIFKHVLDKITNNVDSKEI
ncbi:organic hydroperoxide resistance transcriptional regulator [Clostridium homopropionicum DSM 5847]|uniref:Organic hydroperoxide resistance transcriptional regulator n=1 Tax=Clostridium homopropionicum DSM 5847 TaxID=1121318 RepID=A0A0L6ZEY9_9CLOT|nr:MarR family transcriptional regulator [Clostridium homopropionicum]KOA21541.1 organic hydroperoxide resistance transcriptional regulator [Clostridium homopropionicum DSM 5847]SFG06403.1 transcriptional regulator, MarR family [Clostridium homopropionicum]